MDLITTTLPVAPKDLPTSPRFTPHDFYRDASSAILQLVNQWLNFTYSRSHAFRYERKNTNPTLVRIELTTSALLAGVQVTPTRPLGRRGLKNHHEEISAKVRSKNIRRSRRVLIFL